MEDDEVVVEDADTVVEQNVEVEVEEVEVVEEIDPLPKQFRGLKQQKRNHIP